ncbi:MAG: EI24 domain-containing protein [Burkholderiales bacterium]
MARALVSLAHPKMLLLMIWPLFLSALLWIALAFAFWTQASQWIDVQLKSTDMVQWLMTVWPFALVAAHLAGVILVMITVPLVLVVAVVLTSIFAMPVMVSHVATREYPLLAALQGGSFSGSLWNAVLAVLVFLFLVAVTLPLWLFAIFWPVLPVLLFAYLNQRMFRYDALAEHASAAEIATLTQRHRFEYFGLGVIVALFSHIPILGFFMPVYAGLAFIHFSLGRLKKLRDEKLNIAPSLASS